jgi:hypothetical protein
MHTESVTLPWVTANVALPPSPVAIPRASNVMLLEELLSCT